MRHLPLLALSCLTVLGALPASAQVARSIYLYNASSGQGVVQDARAGLWGNGTSQKTGRVDYEGASTLQVTTRSFAEGVRFDLARPVDPTPYMNNGFMRLRLKFREIGGGAGGGMGMGGDPRGGGGMGMGGDPRGGGMGMGGDPRGGGFRGQGEMVPRWNGAAQIGRRGGGALPDFGGAPGNPGFGPPGMMGEGGEGGMATGPLPQTTYIKEMKITLMREQGVMTGRFKINLNSRDNEPDDNGWRLYTLALKDMTSTPNASGNIQRVILTSDTQDTFYMAQMALVVETGQITASIRTPDKAAGTQMAEVEWKPERPLTLVADVEAGAADPQVEWNFDADNVGNLPAPAINGGVGGMNPDGTPAMGGDPRMGGMMGDPRGGRDPRSQLGMGGGDPRMGGGDPRMGGMRGNPAGGAGGDGQPAFLGPRIDARGLSATYAFPNEEQNYRVEVTVRDRSGQKQPVKTSILVRIRG
ncbi:hypothetical protein IAD21_01034 [Abditibacteriota bacterium]|nr:hypothetical protein IAD21_01034 [Abditibacteriota bacterium]